MAAISDAGAPAGVEKSDVRRGPSRGVSRWAIVPAVALAAGAQSPLLAATGPLFRSLTPWSVVPLVVAGMTLAIAWARFDRYRRGGGIWFGRLVWIGAAVLTAIAVALRSPAIATAAFLVTLLAALGATAGSTVRRAVFPAWLCACLAVPFAFGGGILFDLLHAGATRQASTTLDLMEIRHRVTASSLEVPRKVFAISRLDGVFRAALAVTCLLAVALGRGAVWTAALLVVTPLWVFGFQIFAIALPVYLGARGDGADVVGWPNWWLPAAGVGVATLLTWATDRGLAWLMPHGGEATWRMVRAILLSGSAAEEGGPATEDAAPERRVGWTGAIVLTGTFAAVAALWLLPPIGAGAAGSVEEARLEVEKDADGPK